MRYRQGWKALNRLLHEGRSFSGHEPHCVFLNTLSQSQDEQFATVSAVTGLDFAEDGRAIVMTDWDFDGRLDAWITNRTAPCVRLMRNVGSGDNNFVAFRLHGDGKTSNRDAIGARVELKLVGDPRPLIKTQHAGDAFLSQSSAWMQFGLGKADEIESVVVRWPGGAAQEFAGLEVNARYDLTQHAVQAARWTPPAERRQLIASEPRVAEPDPSARIVLLAPILLPNVWTHDSADPLNERLEGPTLLTLWSATCGPCLEELKQLAERKQEIDARGLDVIAINLDQLSTPSGSIDALLDRLGFSHGSERGSEQLVTTFDLVQRSVLDLWVDLAVPTSFLIDDSGQLAVIYRGPVSVDQALADLQLLGESSEALRDEATPFTGQWRAEVPKANPMRVLSQLVDANKLSEGIEYLERYAAILAESPDKLSFLDTSELFFVLAVLKQDRGDLDGAAQTYQQALSYEPEDVRIRKAYAELLVKKRRLEAAADQLAEAVRFAPEDMDAHRKLALLQSALNRLPEAIDSMTKVVEDQPGDIAMLYNLANTLRTARRLPEAISRYEQVLQRSPNMVPAANNLAWIRATHPNAIYRDGEQAVRLATQICAATQQANAGYLDTLAAAYAETGDFDRATSTIRKALALLDGEAAGGEELRNRLQLYQQDRPYRDEVNFGAAAAE